MRTSFMDKRPPSRWSFMVYWDCRASKSGDNLASVRKQVTNFQKSIEMAKETSIEIKGEWGWETNC